MALFGAKKTKDDKDTEEVKDLGQLKDLKAAKVAKVAKAAKPAKEVKVSKEKTEEKVATEATSMKDLYADESGKKIAKSKKAKSDSRYDGAYRVLVKPLVTEKATDLSVNNKYVFVVSNAANKIEVAKAINVVYGVKPVAVNIISMKGKTMNRGKIKGQRKDWKKAIVSLKKGDSIKIYEGV